MKKTIIIIAMMLIVTILGGCKGTRYNDIPLSEGDIPYILPPDIYVDIDGNVHHETKPRWSLSEADVYEYVKWLQKSK